MTASEFVCYLKAVRLVPDGWMALCPAHDDQKPSLSVSEKGGRILLHCFAGCRAESIVSAVSLSITDLFAGTDRTTGARIVATYDFRDELGNLLYQEVRYDPKGFRVRRPDGKGGWHWNLDSTRRVLYNLPALLKADPLDPIFICEGCKDCQTANDKLGLTATTNIGGANASWLGEYSEFLRRKHVVIICDADAPGSAHGREVACSLRGIAASIKLIEALPGVPDKGDLTDYITGGGTRESLLEFAAACPVLTAADVAKWTPVESVSGFSLTRLGDLLNKPSVPVDYIWHDRLV
jgi:hypothetical protein